LLLLAQQFAHEGRDCELSLRKMNVDFAAEKLTSYYYPHECIVILSFLF